MFVSTSACGARLPNVRRQSESERLKTYTCSKTTPPQAKGGFPGNVGNHIATPLHAGHCINSGLLLCPSLNAFFHSVYIRFQIIELEMVNA